MVNGVLAGAARQFVSNLIPSAATFTSVPFGEHDGPWACFFASAANQVSKSCGDITWTVKVIALWNSPQNSAHSPTYVPWVPRSRFSSNMFVRPGTTSRLKNHDGTKKEWMT